MQWSAEMSDRIGDWLGLSNRSCLAEKRKEDKAMKEMTELPRICVWTNVNKVDKKKVKN